MTAPFEHPAPIGSTEELREFMADCLSLASLYAQHGLELCQIGDDLGLETNVRKLIAATKAAASTLRDLKFRAQRDAA